MIEKKFWKPAITSQLSCCPIPFHLDTYRGCTFNCLYCFARDIFVFQRRNSKNNSFFYLYGNRSDLFEKWFALIQSKETFTSEEAFIKNRIPLKIGANSDPFPIIEKEEHVTRNILKVLHKYDYPVEIQTKNPQGILDIVDEFENPNWTVAISLISLDENFIKIVEPNAPSSLDRIEAIHKLTNKKINVMVKVQPAIYPKILDDLEPLIKKIKEVGCWAFNIEGLKLRISMPKKEQELYKKLNKYLNFDLREFYKTQNRTSSDYELSIFKKMEYANLALKLSKKYDIKYFSADNDLFCGSGDECCGTEVLRNYKVWGYNERSFKFGGNLKHCKELEQYKITKTRNKNKNITLKEYVDKKACLNCQLF